MHASTDRRLPQHPRVPLDLWVRLRHEDFAEPFDADGVDLSRGGLALRSDFLPEVGDRLRCRFDSPADGDELEIGGEVVWAHDAGERSGQFGLRFTDLDGALEQDLASIVKRLSPEAAARIKLHLDGVASPVEADVVELDDEWLTAEQSLPFLKLGMGVVVEGSGGPPRGRLASVSLRVEDGMPRLVLQVDLEAEVASPTAGDTLDEDEPLEADVEAAPETSDETVQDWVPPVEVTRDPKRAAEDVKVFAVDEDEALDEDEPSLDLRDDDARDAITPGDLRAPIEDEATGLGAKLAPHVQKAKAALAPHLTRIKEKAGPTTRALLAKVAAFFAMVWAKAKPAAAAAWAKTKKGALALSGAVARKVLKKGRRRTAAPPKRVAESPKLRRQRRAGAEPEVEAPRNKPGRKVVLAGVIAAAAVGATVYAVSGDDEVPAEEPAVVIAETPPAPVVETPAEIDPEAGELAAPVEPETEAAAAPEPAGGRLEEPTFPSLSDANDRRDAPVQEGTSFGAAEVEGRSWTLNMSLPVSVIRGQAQDNGFTVTIPNALSESRASVIAAQHPDIERASVLNFGDHSVLTVRFVAGRSPAYRVEAAGRAIRLTVAR